MSARASKSVINNGLANISDDTILRLVKKTIILINKEDETKVCIDDFALKKRHNYGTVIIDIDTHKIITVSYGGFTATCFASIVVMPDNSTVASNTTPTFSTDYGLIDVIWLEGTTNNVTDTPNEPNLYTNLATEKQMTPVTWRKTTDSEGNEIWEEDVTAKTKWYSYTAESGTDGKKDNTTSMWANAKNSDGSYFVWIPRYAYRITYYLEPSYDTVTGYYDGWGLWNAEDGTLNYGFDEGIKYTEYNGNRYIVHPSFMGIGSEDVGGGFGTDSNGITGFWVSKYEMSRTGATVSSAGSGYNTTFLSISNVSSARSITIGNMFNVSKSYDSDKESYMMKNSEWGAVAYLTQSQYGRNGYEISVNQCSGYVTGAGRGLKASEDTTGSATGTSDIYNAYYSSSNIKDAQKYNGSIGVLSQCHQFKENTIIQIEKIPILDFLLLSNIGI